MAIVERQAYTEAAMSMHKSFLASSAHMEAAAMQASSYTSSSHSAAASFESMSATSMSAMMAESVISMSSSSQTMGMSARSHVKALTTGVKTGETLHAELCGKAGM